MNRAITTGTVLLALAAGGVMLAGSASAHDNTVTGASSCSDGAHVVAWTVTNDYGLSERATSRLGSVHLGKYGSGGWTETVPAGVTTVTLNVHGRWSDGYRRDDSGSVTLVGDCKPTPTPTETTPSTHPSSSSPTPAPSSSTGTSPTSPVTTAPPATSSPSLPRPSTPTATSTHSSVATSKPVGPPPTSTTRKAASSAKPAPASASCMSGTGTSPAGSGAPSSTVAAPCSAAPPAVSTHRPTVSPPLASTGTNVRGILWGGVAMLAAGLTVLGAALIRPRRH